MISRLVLRQRGVEEADTPAAESAEATCEAACLLFPSPHLSSQSTSWQSPTGFLLEGTLQAISSTPCLVQTTVTTPLTGGCPICAQKPPVKESPQLHEVWEVVRLKGLPTHLAIFIPFLAVHVSALSLAKPSVRQ